MLDSIVYGTYAIILPYKRHKKYTGNHPQKPLCKVSPFNNGEMIILKSLSQRSEAENFLIPLLDSVEVKLSDNMPNKMKKFKRYLDDLYDPDKPQVYHGTFSINYMLFKCAEIDLFEICNDFSCGLKSYFSRNTNNKYRNMVTNLIEAINFLHTLGICHFDIKPENVVLDVDDGRFKLIDFGFAEAFPFKSYISCGPRGTMEYIPFNTSNKKIIDSFSKIDPYIPCNDWTRGENTWMHYYYGNDPSRNLCIKNSQIYKSDIYALGKTFYRTLQILKTDKNIKVIDSEFIKAFINGDVFTRILITDVPVIPEIILENSEDSRQELEYSCANFNIYNFFMTSFSKLKSFNFT